IYLAIVERAAALFPALGDAHGWSLHFGRELNASDDKDLFRPPGQGLVPVVEGKHIEPFSVDLDGPRHAVRVEDLRRRLDSESFTRSRLAYRDVASATNRLTLIAA